MTAVLLISRSHEYEVRLQGLLGGNLTSVMGAFLTFGTEIVLRHIDSQEQPEVVFLGPYIGYESATELSAGLRERYPEVSIVIVHENAAAIAEWVTEMGAKAVISPAADEAEVLELVGRLSTSAEEDETVSASDEKPVDIESEDEPDEIETDERIEADQDDLNAPPPELVEAHPVASRVIAVVSPKGGLGKTTVAANLAVGLARIAPDSVVLVDGDVQFGDIGAVLALNPAHTLPDMVSGLAPRDTMVLKTFLASHPSRFYVVCGSDSPADGDRITGDQFAHLIRQLSEVFRYVIIDTTPGLGEHALAALDMATDAVVLCSLAVPNLRALRKELTVLSSIGIDPATWHVVLNFADKGTGLSAKDAETISGASIDVTIPRSQAVTLSTNRGVPLLQESTRDPAARALTQLVERIGGHSHVASARGMKRRVVA